MYCMLNRFFLHKIILQKSLFFDLVPVYHLLVAILYVSPLETDSTHDMINRLLVSVYLIKLKVILLFIFKRAFIYFYHGS